MPPVHCKRDDASTAPSSVPTTSFPVLHTLWTAGIAVSVLSGATLLFGACATPGGTGAGASSSASMSAYTTWRDTSQGITAAPGCNSFEAATDIGIPGAALTEGMMPVRAAREGVCRLGAEGAPILLVVPATQPRLIGHSGLSILHVGDVISVPVGTDLKGWSQPATEQIHQALNPLSEVSLKDKHLPSSRPKDSAALEELSAITAGKVSMAGTYGYYDGKSADGTEFLKLLLHAEQSGTAQVKLTQSYTKEGRTNDGNNTGVRSLPLTIEVVATGAPLVIVPGEFELNPSDESTPQSVQLGVGDYLSGEITLGFLSRMGSEQRSAPGIQKAP